MIYYLLLSGDEESDTIYEPNMIGEESFKVFYPALGFHLLNKIINQKPEMLEQIQIIDEQKNELKNLKEKFLEIKKLVYAYKDDKEQEIKNLLNDHQDLKSEIDKTKLDYEKILEVATSEIDKFIEKVNQDNSVQ